MMYYKSFFLSLIVLFIANKAVCQLVADAGPDRAYCELFEPPTVALGGSPTASGGVPPYSYSWDVSHHSFGIEDFLVGGTLANPIITNPLGGQEILQFYLTVTDAGQNVAMDTVNVAFPLFGMHLGTFYITIDQGDTICFDGGPNVAGGFAPYEILWYPNHGMIDSTGSGFCAVPQYATNYGSILTDSVGCVIQGSAFVMVTVRPVGVTETFTTEKQVDVYPNPAADYITVALNAEVSGSLTFSLFDDLGKLVMRKVLQNKQSDIDLHGLSRGVYVYKLSNSEDFEFIDKLMVE